MENFSFSVLDPRPILVAVESNDRIFSLGLVLGIEVTVPSLAARCTLGNIDPQHIGDDSSRAAIEVALEADLPPSRAVLATVRADLDSVGAMAVLSLRKGSADLAPAKERIRLIAESDRFAHGGWPGQRLLPTVERLYDDSVASVESDSRLAPIAAAVSDFKVSLDLRVETLKKWLLTGEEPADYRERWLAERKALAEAIASGQIKAELAAEGRIAVVESTHRAATSVGYAMAPVVVALNPEFRLGSGEPHRKFTICAFEARWCDIRAALVELAALEPGWGGSPTIGGSPQGVSSALEVGQVIEVVKRHLKFLPSRPCTCGQGEFGDGHEWSSYCG